MKTKIIKKNSSNRTELFKKIGRCLEKIDHKIEIEFLEKQKYLYKYNITNTPCLNN